MDLRKLIIYIMQNHLFSLVLALSGIHLESGISYFPLYMLLRFTIFATKFKYSFQCRSSEIFRLSYTLQTISSYTWAAQSLTRQFTVYTSFCSDVHKRSNACEQPRANL
jgi:hypothetical protein